MSRPRSTQETSAKPSRPSRSGRCDLCGREGQPSTFHHLIPRHCHRKPRFRRKFSLQEMRTRGLWLCPPCHSGIHDLIPDEQLLGWDYHDRERLLEHPGVARHVAWVRKLK